MLAIVPLTFIASFSSTSSPSLPVPTTGTSKWSPPTSTAPSSPHTSIKMSMCFESPSTLKARVSHKMRMFQIRHLEFVGCSSFPLVLHTRGRRQNITMHLMETSLMVGSLHSSTLCVSRPSSSPSVAGPASGALHIRHHHIAVVRLPLGCHA